MALNGHLEWKWVTQGGAGAPAEPTPVSFTRAFILGHGFLSFVLNTGPLLRPFGGVCLSSLYVYEVESFV